MTSRTKLNTRDFLEKDDHNRSFGDELPWLSLTDSAEGSIATIKVFSMTGNQQAADMNATASSRGV